LTDDDDDDDDDDATELAPAAGCQRLEANHGRI